MRHGSEGIVSFPDHSGWSGRWRNDKPVSTILLRRQREHFFIDAAVNNRRVRFMIDTGATLVSLNGRDAKAVGLDVAKLNFNGTSYTANGPMKTAPVCLSIGAGSFTARNVPGSVRRERTGDSLLGMSFLKRFDMQIRGDTMTLRQKRGSEMASNRSASGSG